MHTTTARALAASLALVALAACGGGETATADSPAAAGTATSTPPQPEGPMNMVDSATRAPQTADSLPPGAVRRDSGATLPPADSGHTKRP